MHQKTDQKKIAKKIDLAKLENLAIDNLELVLNDLEIFDYEKTENGYRSRCHIHDGNNPTAWYFFIKKKAWNCYTHQCHSEHGNRIFNFVMAMKEITFIESVDYLCNLFSVTNSEDFKAKEEEMYLRKIKNSIIQNVIKKKTFSADCLDKLADCSKYMNKRGFGKDEIDEFRCGYAKSGKLFERVVFPVWDDVNEIVGFIGRTVYEKCEKCGLFHCKNKDGSDSCPKYKTPAKWLCSESFRKGVILYNLNKAKESIAENGSVIITEGIIDLMRFWSAGVKNVVATLGVNVSSQQLILLLSLGTIKKIYLCSDDDNAGEKFKNKHSEYKDLEENKSALSLSRYFNVERISYDGQKDIGEMSREEAVEFCAKIGLLKGE